MASERNDPILYAPMKTGQEAEVCDLVVRSFNEFIAPGYSQEGMKSFLRYVQPDMFLKRSQSNHFVIVASKQSTVIGMIEIRDREHISMLFVDKHFQKGGVARELLQRALRSVRASNPDLRELSVNSSPYAVPIYEKLGFQVSQPEQISVGIRYIPMRLQLRGQR